MKVSVLKLPKSEVKFTIELDDNELADFREKAAASLSSRVQIPGFREGKAPSFTVEAQVGKQAFFQEVLRFALPATYSKAVAQEKIPVISRPKITVATEYPLKYEAVAALMPEIKLANYEKVKIPKESDAVKDQEVSDVIKEMRKVHAEYKPRVTVIEKGDRVEIDFEGFDEQGTAVPNTKSKNHPLFVGEGTLVTGFEENLVGMKINEKKKFTVAFPKDFGFGPLKGKTVTFEVEMKKAEETVLPLLDEAFVQKIYGSKISVPEFEKIVREDVSRQKRRETRERRENKLLEEWLKLAEIELPQTLVDEEVDYLIDQLKFDLERQNIKFADYEAYLKSKNRDLRKEKEEEAKKRLMVRLVLNEIFKKEKIDVSAEEIKKAIEDYVNSSPKEEQAKVREMFEKDRSRKLQVENNIRLRKLFDRFLA